MLHIDLRRKICAQHVHFTVSQFASCSGSLQDSLLLLLQAPRHSAEHNASIKTTNCPQNCVKQATNKALSVTIILTSCLHFWRMFDFVRPVYRPVCQNQLFRVIEMHAG